MRRSSRMQGSLMNLNLFAGWYGAFCDAAHLSGAICVLTRLQIIEGESSRGQRVFTIGPGACHQGKRQQRAKVAPVDLHYKILRVGKSQDRPLAIGFWLLAFSFGVYTRCAELPGFVDALSDIS